MGNGTSYPISSLESLAAPIQWLMNIGQYELSSMCCVVRTVLGLAWPVGDLLSSNLVIHLSFMCLMSSPRWVSWGPNLTIYRGLSFLHNGDPRLLKPSSNQRNTITLPRLRYAWTKVMATERSVSVLCVRTFLAPVDQSLTVVRFLRASPWWCRVDLRAWACWSFHGLERVSMFIRTHRPLPELPRLCGLMAGIGVPELLESASRSCRTWLVGKWAGSGAELRELQLDMPACGADICATALGSVESMTPRKD